jgi:autotransporter-associated beta strand protein
MKRATCFCAFVLCAATILPSAGATTLYWDGDGTGVVGGGAGTWNTANLRWSTTPGGSTYQGWVNANQDSAVFGVAAGAITTGAVTVNVIETDVSGYSFDGSTITFAGADAGVFANHTSGTTTLSGPYTGASLTKTGPGRVDLNESTNTIGKYILNAGFVTISAYNRLGTAPGTLVPDWLTFNGGGFAVAVASGDLGATRGITIKSGGAFFGAAGGADDIQITSPIVGTEGGGLTITSGAPFYSPYNAGATVTLLNTANSWDGPTTIGGSSTLKLGANNVIPDTSNVTLSNSSSNTFDMNNFSDTINRLSGSNSSSKIMLGTAGHTLTINNPSGQSISAIISEAGNIVKNGTGTQTFAGTNDNTYTGSTTVNNGVLQLNKTAGKNAIGGSLTIGDSVNTASVKLLQANQFIDTSQVTINANGTFDMNNLFDTIGSLAGAGAVINMTDLMLTRTGGTALYSGNYSGNGVLTMNGAYTQQLTGTNTSGTTTVTLGTLSVDGGSVTNTGSATVNGGSLVVNAAMSANDASVSSGSLVVNGTMTTTSGTSVAGGVLRGTGSLTGTANVSSGAIAPGVGAGNATLTVDSLTLNGGSLKPTLGVPGSPLGSSDYVNVSGANAFTLNFSTLEIATANGVADGTYRVAKYDGAIGGSGFGGLLNSTQAGFDSIQLVDNTTDGAIDVTIDIMERTWLADGSNNWSDSNNWGSALSPAGPASPPEGPGAIANFGNTTPTNPAKTVTLDGGNKTVGVINFTGSSNYTIDGTNTLIMDTWGADGLVNVGSGATHSISAPVQLNKSTNFAVAGAGDTFEVSGAVSGTGGVIKSGPGTLKLSATNAYTGGNTVSAGTLLGNTSSIQGAIADNGSVIFDQAADGTFTSSISGTGSVTKNGAGQLTLTASSHSYSGGFNLNNGTVAVGSATALGAANSPVTISNGTTLTSNSTSARSLTYTWTVNGDFTLGQTATGTGAVTMAGAGGVNLGTSVRAITVNNATDTISAVISGAGGGITKNGTGTLVVTAINTYTGPTTINTGSMQIDGDSTFGNGAGLLTLAGGGVIVSANRPASTAPVANPISMTADTLVSTTSTASTVDLNFSNDNITGSAGTLTFRNNGADGATDTFQPRFTGVINFSQPIIIDNGTTGKTKLQSFNATGSQLFSGQISGSGSYSRTASNPNTGATTEFTGNNTYSGGTTINDGTLKVNNTSGSGTGTGPVAVGTGLAATPNRGTLAGTGSISGLITVQEGGTIAPGNSVGTLTATGGLTLAPLSNLNFELGAPGSPYGTGDLINVTGGTMTINGGTVNLFDAGGLGAGTYKLIDYVGALAGSFGSLALGGTQPAGFTYSLVNNTGNTSIDLLVTAATANGDWNGDTKVNAADYVTWRKDEANFGGTEGSNPSGYITWRANFDVNAASGSGLEGSAVPEPSSVALIGVVGIGFFHGRRRRA